MPPKRKEDGEKVTASNEFGDSESFDGFIVQNEGRDQEFTADIAAGYYTAEVTLAEGQKAGYWGMEVLSADRILSGGFNLGGGYNSDSAPGFGAFLIEEDEAIQVNVNAQPLGGQPQPELMMSLFDSERNSIAGPILGTTSVELNAPLQSGFFTLTLASESGKGAFQLGVSADHFSAGVIVGGYIEENIVGFGGFNLPRPTTLTIRLYNSTYGTASSGRVQLRLVDSAGQPVSVTRVEQP